MLVVHTGVDSMAEALQPVADAVKAGRALTPEQQAVVQNHLAVRTPMQQAREHRLDTAQVNFNHPPTKAGFAHLYLERGWWVSKIPTDQKVKYRSLNAAVAGMDTFFRCSPRPPLKPRQLPAWQSGPRHWETQPGMAPPPALMAPPAPPPALPAAPLALAPLFNAAHKERKEDDDQEIADIDDNATFVATRISPDDSVSRRGSPSLREDVVHWSQRERCVSPGAMIISRERFSERFDMLTRGQQLEAYCGNNTELVEYAIERYGGTPGGMSTDQIKNWYKADMEGRMPSHLQGLVFGIKDGDVQVCHIVSKAKGGHDWIYNYFLAIKAVNMFFGKYLPLDWDRYIGKDAAKMSETFARWVSKRAKAVLCFGEFKGQLDYYLAR